MIDSRLVMATQQKPNTNRNEIGMGLLIINMVFSGASFAYAREMERRLATMEANMALVMQTYDLVPKHSEQSGR